MKDNLESALSPPWLRPPLLSAQCPQPHLTCGGRGGGSRVRPQSQASDVPDTPATCPQPRPAQWGSCQAFAFSEPGLGGCQCSGTGVRVASFQKLRELGGRREGVCEACSWVSFCVSVPPKMIQAVRSPQVQSVGGQLSGARPRAQVALSLVPGSGRPPRQSWAATGAGGCRCGRFGLPGGGLTSTGPEAPTWDRSSSSSRAAGFRAPLLPFQPLCTNFSPASSFPAEAGHTERGPGAHWPGGEGRGAPSLRAPRWRGEGGAPGCADPTTPRGDALGGIPALRGREGRGVWFPRLQLTVPGGGRRRGVWEALVLSPAPSEPLRTRLPGASSETSVSNSLLPAPSGLFLASLPVGRNVWWLGREVNRCRTYPERLRCVRA